MASFKLKEGFNRLVIEVETMVESLVILANEVFTTEDPAAIRALSAHEAVEPAGRAPKHTEDVGTVSSSSKPSGVSEA